MTTELPNNGVPTAATLRERRAVEEANREAVGFLGAVRGKRDVKISRRQLADAVARINEISEHEDFSDPDKARKDVQLSRKQLAEAVRRMNENSKEGYDGKTKKVQKEADESEVEKPGEEAEAEQPAEEPADHPDAAKEEKEKTASGVARPEEGINTAGAAPVVSKKPEESETEAEKPIEEAVETLEAAKGERMKTEAEVVQPAGGTKTADAAPVPAKNPEEPDTAV